jgi:hypothetical protein
MYEQADGVALVAKIKEHVREEEAKEAEAVAKCTLFPLEVSLN